MNAVRGESNHARRRIRPSTVTHGRFGSMLRLCRGEFDILYLGTPVMVAKVCLSPYTEYHCIGVKISSGGVDSTFVSLCPLMQGHKRDPRTVLKQPGRNHLSALDRCGRGKRNPSSRMSLQSSSLKVPPGAFQIPLEQSPCL